MKRIAMLSAIVFVFVGCFSPWQGDKGTFSISIGSPAGNGRATVPWNDDYDVGNLTHYITLSGGPGPEQTKIVKDTQKIYFSVTPGSWNISVEAYAISKTDGNRFLIAVGSRPVEIKPGSNAPVAITMGEPVPVCNTVSIAAIPDVTIPATGATPVTAIETAQYTGIVVWDPVVESTFADGTVYTAAITLTAGEGFTFSGITADFFTVAGALSVSNAANSGVVTAVFPATDGTEPFSVTRVTISGPSTVLRGGNAEYKAAISYSGDPSDLGEGHLGVVWSIMETGKSASTTITNVDGNGLLTVAENESLATLTIEAVSVYDASKKAACTVTVTREFVPVTEITGVLTEATAGTPLTLTGTTVPSNATNQTITWNIEYTGNTGATLTNGNILNTTAAGTVTVVATIADGTAVGVSYTQDFPVTVNKAFVAVTNITGVPETVTVGTPLTLTGTVVPSNATNQTIEWTVAGTGATLTNGNTLNATAAGTVTVVATIADGLAVGMSYTQDFPVTVTPHSYDIEDFGPNPVTSYIFNVSTTTQWRDAVSAITNGDSNKNYVINVSGNFYVSGSTAATFGDVTGIKVSLRGAGSTLTLPATETGSILYIGSNQTIILRDVILQGHSLNNASLMHVDGGTFTMQSGEISGNTAMYGGGVRVGNHGTFTLSGDAVISGNEAKWGGGVNVGSYGTFYMIGGTISNNEAKGDSDSSGGGVNVGENGIFNMSGGNISDKNISKTGGGVNVWKGKFTMYNGKIYGNEATDNGGGVVVGEGGEFTMHNGKIFGNTGKYGGGVMIGNGTNNAALFTMKGGGIYNNTAKGDGNSGGGGVYVDGSATFIMEDGEIFGNTAIRGGGVMVYGGTFQIATGIIYGSNESDDSLKNTASSNNSAALYMYTGSTVQYGTFDDSGKWTPKGTLSTNNNTIKVEDGVRQQ